MILVETGQEAAWDAKVQEHQEEHKVLGDRPLVVIKGNSLLRKWKDLESDEQVLKEKAASGAVVRETEKARLMMKRNLMLEWEKNDARLKRRQLKMSKRGRWVELQDVGHQVVRDMPEKVAEEAEWVVKHLKGGKCEGGSGCNSVGGSAAASPSSSRRTSLEGGAGGNRSGSASPHPEKGGMKGWFRKASLALSKAAAEREGGRKLSR
jgi:hypothetical protein